MFPHEVLSNILSFAQNDDIFQCRSINSQWYNAANEQGCLQLRFSKRLQTEGVHSSDSSSLPRSIFYRANFNGHQFKTKDLTTEVIQDTKTRMDSKEEIRRSWYNRTRGHLPEPRMPQLPSYSDYYYHSANDRNVMQEFARTGHTEQVQHGFCLFMLRIDVSQDTYLSLHLCHSWVEKFAGIPRVLSSRSMKDTLQQVNLGGLKHLQHISIRGMSVLTKIYLPPSIVALDASSCSKLQQIHIPLIGCNKKAKELELISVNWNGCRSLCDIFGPTCAVQQATIQVKELDLSSTLQLPKTIVTAALKATKCLQSVSLRYVATDEVIIALSQSESAFSTPAGTLKLVDVAFSPHLTDKSVMVLVQNATKLERLNLRGCRSISSECYNSIPIILQQRNQKEADAAVYSPRGGELAADNMSLLNKTDLLGSDSSSSPDKQQPTTAFRKRKGDNVFFFVSSLEQKRPQAKKQPKHHR